MKAAAIREMTVDEISLKLEELQRDYLNLRFAHATQQLESPAKLKGHRRDIARIKTILEQKKRAK